jgi:hypothetical protein
LRRIFIITILVLNFTDCGILGITDPNFKDDIDYDRDAEIEFNPNIVPIVGVTTEEELLKMYDNQVMTKYSYINEYHKNLFEKDIKVKKKYVFDRRVREEVIGESYVESILVESLFLIVFVDEKDIVVEYLIKHKIRRPEQEEWGIGPYVRFDYRAKQDEFYYGHEIDEACYWLQRRDRNYKYPLIKIRTLKCPYWEGVPAW